MEKEKLESCYRTSLQLAVENECKSVAFPNISTGIYRFPKLEAARIAVRTVRQFLVDNNAPERVIFVCFDDENYNYVRKELENAQEK